jgi:hypothetical protein
MNTSNLRQLIRESINEYIRSIDEAGERAAVEAKMNATKEAIELREKKMNMEGLDEAYHDMLDENKMKQLKDEVKALKKSLSKYEKQLSKFASKETKPENTEKKEIVDEVEIETGEPNIGEEIQDPESGPQLEYEELNEQILYMQKMAGILTNEEYAAKLEEVKKKKPSAGLTKKQKSTVSKKAHTGKDIGKKGKGFEKIAKSAEKRYGSKEAGERVAAAAMWKNIKRK